MEYLKVRVRSFALSIVVTIVIVAGYVVLVAAGASPPILFTFLLLAVMGLVGVGSSGSGRK